MRVSSQTVTFRRDLCIRGLRSTIRATDQKVNFWSTSEASRNKHKFKKKLRHYSTLAHSHCYPTQYLFGICVLDVILLRAN
jgi:hypothetical protein